MTELTKEYFDKKFEEFATMVAKGFENTATKDDIIRLEKQIKKMGQNDRGQNRSPDRSRRTGKILTRRNRKKNPLKSGF